MYVALNPPITNVFDLPQRRGGQPGDLRSDRVRGEVIRRMETLWPGPLRGQETSQEQGCASNPPSHIYSLTTVRGICKEHLAIYDINGLYLARSVIFLKIEERYGGTKPF